MAGVENMRPADAGALQLLGTVQRRPCTGRRRAGVHVARGASARVIVDTSSARTTSHESPARDAR
jgi:hypothetical protein